MPKLVEVHNNRTDAQLRMPEDRMNALKTFLTVELEDAISSRFSLEQLWRDLLRMYDGVPKNPVKNFPIENAPNTEITLGAIAADAIAQYDGHPGTGRAYE